MANTPNIIKKKTSVSFSDPLRVINPTTPTRRGEGLITETMHKAWSNTPNVNGILAMKRVIYTMKPVHVGTAGPR